MISGKVERTSVFVVPVESRGRVFYGNPSSQTSPHFTGIITASRQQNLLSINAPTFMRTMSQSAPVAPANLRVQDLAQLLAASKKDHLREGKLFHCIGDPHQWHEWFGQFKYAIDSAFISNDVKLTYLKTLVTGKAKAPIAEFAYCGTMCQNALRTLERNFRQPHAVVRAHLDKMSQLPALKMHNSKNIIINSVQILALVGVFRSLHHIQDLTIATLLGYAIKELPTNLTEAGPCTQ